MESAEILEHLVAFPTVSRDSNLALIEYVRGFLAQRGIPARLYPDATAPKANLYARIGPAERAGVLLSGHTDVVPVQGQAWSTDPFRLTERGGRLYARGAADMKGFIACALRAAERAAARPLREPLELAFSYDEEVGCVGVRSLIADMQHWERRPRLCIVGEPTRLATAIAHKGKTSLRAVCRGRAAHSSIPDRGINAIYLASAFIGKVRERQEELVRFGPRDPGYEDPHTTLHVGTILGGSALNVVPAHCELELEVRNLPAQEPGLLVGALRADAAAVAAASARPAEASIALEITHEYPALETPHDAPVVELVAALTGHREPIKVGFGSEAGLYSSCVGVPSVVCGPGSIDQAHRADEFIEADQLRRCDAMLDALLERLS